MKLSFLFSLALVSVVLVTQYQNCGSAKDKEATKLMVRFPKNTGQEKLNIKEDVSPGVSQGPTLSFDIWNGDVGALSVGDLNCFGIAVGGPEQSLQTARCEDTSGNPISFGVHNMGALAGETVSLKVDSGSSRVINILAWKSEDNGSCRTLQTGKKVRGSKLSRPLLIGQVVRDLAGGDQVVNVNASFKDAKPLIGCSIFTKDPNDGREEEPLAGNIGGTVSGLGPDQEVTLHLISLRSQDSSLFDSVSVGNGPYSFGASIEPGEEFFVFLSTFPNDRVCEIEGGGGELGPRVFSGAKITDVNVTCEPGFTISGHVEGFDPGEFIFLKAFIGGNEFDGFASLPANPPVGSSSLATAFSFPAQPVGLSYSVSIESHPPGKTCVFSDAGDSPVGDLTAPVNLVVVCEQTEFSVGGMISGYNPIVGTVTLRLLQSDSTISTFIVPANGPYEFELKVSPGSYSIYLDAPYLGSEGPACVFEVTGDNIDLPVNVENSDVQNINIVCIEPPTA